MSISRSQRAAIQHRTSHVERRALVGGLAVDRATVGDEQLGDIDVVVEECQHDARSVLVVSQGLRGTMVEEHLHSVAVALVR